MSLEFVVEPTIELFVKRHLGLDFFTKPENRKMFLEVWSDLRIK